MTRLRPTWPVVLFDLDGTLANTIPLIIASYQHAFRTVLSEEVDEDVARAWIGRPLLDALLEEAPDHGHELDRVYREWNVANTERLIRSYPGVPDMLTELGEAGVRMGVVTSKRHFQATLAMELVGITGLIDLVSTLESTAEHKPHPAPLLHAATVLDVDPLDCVYVGDATVDVLAAGAAGMSSVAVPWGAGLPDHLRDAGADHLCHTVEELTGLLLGR